jgi:hypothetical protein
MNRTVPGSESQRLYVFFHMWNIAPIQIQATRERERERERKYMYPKVGLVEETKGGGKEENSK